jgi:MFS family permease
MTGNPVVTPPAGAARRARIAVACVFLSNGAAVGSWVPHIPDVQSALELSNGVLGLALLAVAAGSLVGLPTAGALAGRVGSRIVVRVSALAVFATLPLPLLAPSLPAFVAALALFGVANGALDVAMNLQALAVEDRLGRPTMSSCHGSFSAGGLIGAGGAGPAMWLGLGPVQHLLAVAVILLLVNLPALIVLLPAPAPGSRQPVFAAPRGRLMTLGLLALCALLAEGSMGDWSAVYLRQIVKADAGFAALGYAAFSLAMTLGRLAGDRIIERHGPIAVLAVGAAAATGLLGSALLLASPWAALLGFAGVGVGIANAIPILFGAAGRLPGIPAGIALAAVSTAGYCGFLAGPPLIGLVAELIGLSAGLGLVVTSMAVIAVGAAALRPGIRPRVEALGGRAAR